MVPWVITYCGPIQHPASTRFRNTLISAAVQGIKDITVLFSSNGGTVEEGMILFNIIRAMPVKPTFYAVGPVDSIALSVFLGADTRFCSPFCRFLIHEAQYP
jgi:ATP-dependent Clp protease, protease subunit